jgi:hypothetical protein
MAGNDHLWPPFSYLIVRLADDTDHRQNLPFLGGEALFITFISVGNLQLIGDFKVKVEQTYAMHCPIGKYLILHTCKADVYMLPSHDKNLKVQFWPVTPNSVTANLRYSKILLAFVRSTAMLKCFSRQREARICQFSPN